MITARDLEAFEEQNGLTHPPYRDLNDWAGRVNRNDGYCLCATDRRCPCPEALEDIRGATDPKRACCKCTLFCDNRYIEAWGHNAPKKSSKVATSTPITRGEISNPEVKIIIETFQRAKTEIGDDKAMAAYETLINEGEKDHCDACQKFMMAEAHRALFLVYAAEADLGEYKVEKERALRKMDELIDLYYQVDKMDETGKPAVEHIPAPGPTPRKMFRSDYHKCASAFLNDPANKEKYPDRKERFAGAVAACGHASRDGQ